MKKIKGNYKIIFSSIISFITVATLLLGCSYDAVSQQNTVYTNSGAEVKIHYIDVGQADSILIQSPDNKNMLIDAGETKDRAVLNYLDKMNIKKLDAVVATHPHADHISEMADVINNYEIADFYTPKVSHTSKTFENMIDTLAAKNITPIAAKSEMNFNLGENIKCEILAPCNDEYSDLNNYSVVIKMTYGENSFLFTGDAEALSESEIIKSGVNLKSDVLKLGHHGSSTSTSDEFLKAVNPSYAIISCGKDNDYGHPHAETMSKLKGINTYITKDCGTIIVTGDSKNINVHTESETNINTQTELSNPTAKTETNLSTQPEAATNNNTAKTNVQQENQIDSEVNAESYIGNKNSKKYHSESCNSLPLEKNRVYFSSISEAESLGYDAHSNCVNK